MEFTDLKNLFSSSIIYMIKLIKQLKEMKCEEHKILFSHGV